MTHFLEILGVQPSPESRRRMYAMLKRRGIDKAHWRHSPRRSYSVEQLQSAVACSTSFAGVLRALGIPQAGGSQSYLARRIRAEGLDTGHFTGSAHNRGKAFPRLTAEQILVVLPPGSHRRKAPHLRRALRDEGVPDCCDECGLVPMWQGKALTLIVEHRNGDWLDNRLGNLRLLCPNCHSQTATWCRRKTGS
jgi:hypothetical protein